MDLRRRAAVRRKAGRRSPLDPSFLQGVTGGPAAVGAGQQLRDFAPATLVHVRTARVEDTAFGQMDGCGHLALQTDVVETLGTKLWDGREQGAGIGVLRGLVQVVLGRQFAQGAQVHDRHPRADVFHHGQVVG